ncbi:MAG: GAF domain-containing protein [Nitrospinota bacterium]
MREKKENESKPGLKQDYRLRNLLGLLEKEISDYARHLTQQIERLADIGIALSAEHDQDKLLEMIMDEARRFTIADAGTLYMLEKDLLKFKVIQNETLGVRMAGKDIEGMDKSKGLKPVEIKKSNVSGYAAITGKPVNIPDVYESELFDFTGPRKYDEQTGYRSKSMLVVPLKDHEDVIIGVLQLLNAKDPKTGEVIPFSRDFESLTMSLASQAAVAITNANLIKDLEHMIDSIVEVMATAIDERSPYTAGHIKRVAELGVLMCHTINKQKKGVFGLKNFGMDARFR